MLSVTYYRGLQPRFRGNVKFSGTLSGVWFIQIFIIVLQLCAIKATPTFYPYGPLNGDSALARQDDAFTTININFDFSFFGKIFTQIHISTNGIIFFGQGSTAYVPNPFPLNGTLSVAAYWVDSDPREGGDIFYREEFNPVILNQITNFIRNKFVQFNTFTSTWSLIVTFSNVSRYGCRGSTVYPCRNVVNHQTILTSNGIHSFVIFLYDRLEYSNAQIGFNAGDGKRFFLVPYSNTVNISKYALENSNVGSPGEWLFSISDEISAACNSLGMLEIYPKKVLYYGQQDLFINGPCIDRNVTSVEVKIGAEDKITCPVIENNKIKCLTPYIDSNVRIPVSLNYSNVKYNGFFLSYDFGDSLVQNVSYAILNSASSGYTYLAWNQSMYKSNETVLRGIRQLIKRDASGNFVTQTTQILQSISNLENYKLLFPEVPSDVEIIRYVLNIERNVFEVIKPKSSSGMIVEQSGCTEWYNKQKSTSEINQITEAESKRNPCQPTVPSNFPDQLSGGFVKDDACNPSFAGYYLCMAFHNGAKGCYRSTNNPNNIAVQCCYDSNNVLTAGPTSGGTLDMYDSGKSRWQHFKIDVWPYIQCCILSNECVKYYEKRPSVDSKHYVPPRPVRAAGDPHFYTLDGTSYDFNPVGEFILLKVPNTMVQARIQQYYDINNNPKQASFFSAFAIKIYNDIIIQIDFTPSKSLQLKVNDELWNYDSLTLPTVSAIINTNNISLNTVTGLSLQFFNLNGMIHVITALQPNLKKQVQGLMGNWDEDPSNDFMLPNGTWISNTSSLQDIHYKFGMSWTTTNDSTIFSYPDGLKWSNYQRPSFVPFFGQPSTTDSRCGNNTQCIFDTYITGDINLGLSNVFVQRTTEQQQAQYEQMNITCNSKIYIPNADVTYQANSDSTKVNYTITCKNNYKISGKSFVRCINGTLMDEYGSCVYSPVLSSSHIITYHWMSFIVPMVFMLIRC